MEHPRINERLLRSVWIGSRLRNTPLVTTDGKSVTILDPGTANSDGGPDFRNARIRIGGTLYTGDVELHCDASSWYSHGHESDGHYNSTILHVVFDADRGGLPARTRSGREIPLLVINPEESLPLVPPIEPGIHSIRCHALNDGVPDAIKLDWIDKLGRQRVELKVRRFEERLKELIEEQRWAVSEPGDPYHGSPEDRDLWEQLLYEGILEALGYSKNRAPFLALAQGMKLMFLRKHDLCDTGTMMALLFGAAGLLPSSRTVANAESRIYLLGLRKKWKELRPSFSGPLLQPGDWLFFRLRPSNFPTTRLASFCFLLPRLFGEDSFRVIMKAFKDGAAQREIVTLLHTQLHIEPDQFWSHHYYFGMPTQRSVPGIGSSRRNDMIANVILPIVLLYARVFRDQTIRDKALEFLFRFPPLQRNSVTRTIENELLKNRRLNSAIRQQGALQLYGMYCALGRCGECEVGKRVSFSGGKNNS